MKIEKKIQKIILLDRGLNPGSHACCRNYEVRLTLVSTACSDGMGGRKSFEIILFERIIIFFWTYLFWKYLILILIVIFRKWYGQICLGNPYRINDVQWSDYYFEKVLKGFKLRHPGNPWFSRYTLNPFNIPSKYQFDHETSTVQ